MKNYSQITAGVRKNEKVSQMAFYDMFYRPIYQSAYAVTGSREEAEEIMHDTLLKVFLNTDLLQEDPKAMTRVLRRIAANQAIDAIRKRKNFIFPFDDNSMDWEDDDENEEEYEPTISDIKDGINSLSTAYQSIIFLRLFEEMSFAEIAERLQINASTVRVQYSRGISKLRTLLKQQLYANE